MDSSVHEAGARTERGLHDDPGLSWIDRGDMRPAGAKEALVALTTVADRLRSAGDARAAFPDVYSAITRRVTERIALGPGVFFLEPSWISRLAGRFCRRYLETLCWSFEGAVQDAAAWRVAYETCRDPGSSPIVNVLLGLSAHINSDLAIGIYRTIVEVGAAGDPVRLARFKHDHDAVNDLLEESVPEAFARLVDRHGCLIASALVQHAYPLARWAAMHILKTWRARVWEEALALVAAGSAAARDVIVRRMERRAGRYARLLALSVPHAPAWAGGAGATLRALADLV